MGRQIAVAMTEKDEKEFLVFLREYADVQLIESFAPRKEDLFVKEFKPRQAGHWSYDIWNKAFPWTPKFGRVREDIPNVENPGWYYVRNTGDAPLLEYSRHNFDDHMGLNYGRLYWSKYFTADPNSIQYDVAAFSTWYDSVVRWIRKRGKQKTKGTLNPYFLPDAFGR